MLNSFLYFTCWIMIASLSSVAHISTYFELACSSDSNYAASPSSISVGPGLDTDLQQRSSTETITSNKQVWQSRSHAQVAEAEGNKLRSNVSVNDDCARSNAIISGDGQAMRRKLGFAVLASLSGIALMVWL